MLSGGSLMCNGSLSSLNLSGLPSLPSTTSMGRGVPGSNPPGQGPPATGGDPDAGGPYLQL